VLTIRHGTVIIAKSLINVDVVQLDNLSNTVTMSVVSDPKSELLCNT